MSADAATVVLLGCVVLACGLIIAAIADAIAHRRRQSLIREMWDEADRVVHRVECPWNLR